MMRILLLFVFLIFPVMGQSSDLSVLDELIPAQTKKWKIPGLAIAVTIPGQPVYTLELLKDFKFSTKGLSGFSMEFRKDSTGHVNELVVFQPDGNFVAKRKSQNQP